MNLSNQVLQDITKQKLVKRGETVVVGVSGGADSVALLHILHGLRHRLGVLLHVAHFNHRLRVSADRDERFVKALAIQLNLPITISRRKSALKGKLTSEDEARQWRLKFFVGVANQIKASTIVLAHNQNDLAETVFMRLLRGAGLAGLRGILGENEIGGKKFVRPLLSIQRSQIEHYLKAHHIKFCNDETNQQTHYLRNKIRLKLIPEIVKNYNPNFSNSLVSLSHAVQADYDYLLNQAHLLFRKKAIVSRERVTIGLKTFLQQPVSMQRMILRLAFESLVSDFNQLSFTHIKEVEDLVSNRPDGSSVHWPQRVKVVKLKAKLILSCSQSSS
jgi:tRNA(Ile)-lysidine synthase